MKVEVAVLGSPSLISLTVSVDVKQQSANGKSLTKELESALFKAWPRYFILADSGQALLLFDYCYSNGNSGSLDLT